MRVHGKRQYKRSNEVEVYLLKGIRDRMIKSGVKKGKFTILTEEGRMDFEVDTEGLERLAKTGSL